MPSASTECCEGRCVAGAVDIVAEHSDVTTACEKLVQKSGYFWQVEEGDYRDDITVVVIQLPFMTE
jgi:hypothetical protein